MVYAQKRRKSIMGLIPTKTEKFETHGERRIRLEAKYNPDIHPLEDLEGYVREYNDLVNSAVKTLEEMGIGPNNQEEFIVETWAILYGAVDVKLYEQDLLIDCFRKGIWDCDTLSYVVYDIGEKLGIKGLEMVETSGHVFVKTRDFYFDTSSFKTHPTYGSIDDMHEKYPNILGTYSKEDIEYVESLVLGTEVMDQGKYREAIDILEMGLEINDTSSNICTNIGYAYYELGDYDSALEYYNTAYKIEPDEVNITGLAKSRYMTEDFEGARDMCIIGLEMNPKNIFLRKLLERIEDR